MPSAGSAPITAPFSCATASTLCHEFLVFALRIVDQADGGLRQCAASCAISPGWFMPSSMTAALCAASSRNSVSGTPMSLFRLPRVARQRSAPNAAARIAAIISLTVVLPLLPVTPISGMSNCRRQ